MKVYIFTEQEFQQVLTAVETKNFNRLDHALPILKSMEPQEPVAYLPTDVYGNTFDPITLEDHKDMADPACLGEYWAGDIPLYALPKEQRHD